MHNEAKTPAFFDMIRWDAQGLVPAIVQDAATGEVLMVAWMNADSLSRTWTSRQTHFYSRSRASLWHKGGTSGHVQHVQSIHLDCDGDVLLIGVRQVGGACHQGYRSCFWRKVDVDGGLIADAERVFEPTDVYESKQSGGG